MSKYVFTKRPTATLDYTVDWEDWLNGDTIMTSDWVLPTGITKVTDLFTATYSTIWVSGGDANTNYILTNTITTAGGRTEPRHITLVVQTASNISYLIPYVRIKIGDLDSSAYKYIDEWLETSLIASVSSLARWWNYKYLLDSNNQVYRNPNTNFIVPEPPIVERADEEIIVLKASIILLEGTLANSAYDLASWRDAEIAYSNLESARTRKDILVDLNKELENILLPPVKRLAWPKKQTLPGYINKNPYEIGNMK